MQFQNLIDEALTVRKMYEEKEKQIYGSSWTSEEITLGFVGDVGDLAKLILAENGTRNITNSKEKLEAQLAHSLWSVLVLAEMHNVSVETAFFEAMDRLETHLLEAE